MRTFALRTFALLVGLVLVALMAGGRGALVRCAGAAFGGDDDAARVCGEAGGQLFVGLFGVLVVLAALVNLIDYVRFREIGDPPQPALLAAIVTAGVVVASLRLLPERLLVLAHAASVGEAVQGAVALLGTMAFVLGVAVALIAAIAIWLGRRVDAEAEVARPKGDTR